MMATIMTQHTIDTARVFTNADRGVDTTCGGKGNHTCFSFASSRKATGGNTLLVDVGCPSETDTHPHAQPFWIGNAICFEQIMHGTIDCIKLWYKNNYHHNQCNIRDHRPGHPHMYNHSCLHRYPAYLC